VPADAGLGAPWESSIDEFWAKRLSSGDPIQASIGAERVEAAVAKFVAESVKQIEETKCVFTLGALLAD